MEEYTWEAKLPRKTAKVVKKAKYFGTKAGYRARKPSSSASSFICEYVRWDPALLMNPW